eukprot:TRINITY_DN56290_c0_g1_i1.p1 TRINITY_DN56290_c0_g1~~TRINITY_DN56290_c0_g1_i1.p1  ORF type:complete len:179 (+),score=41.71 TRINITY_DN56290_c0_g1_i1:143-679(+)
MCIRDSLGSADQVRIVYREFKYLSSPAPVVFETVPPPAPQQQVLPERLLFDDRLPLALLRKREQMLLARHECDRDQFQASREEAAVLEDSFGKLGYPVDKDACFSRMEAAARVKLLQEAVRAEPGAAARRRKRESDAAWDQRHQQLLASIRAGGSTQLATPPQSTLGRRSHALQLLGN